MAGGYRQEVLNVVLAQLLTQRGVTASPEVFQRRASIDVLVAFRGLRLAIEGEVDDQPSAAEKAWDKAKSRVEQALAHVGVAVVYPSQLRQLPIDALPGALGSTQLRFSFCQRGRATDPVWLAGDVSFLRTALDETFRHLSSEDEIRAAARLLEACVDDFARGMLSWGVAADRVAALLGIPSDGFGLPVNVAKIAGLVVANALLFQEELAKVNPKVRTLRQCVEAKSPHDELLTVWRFILDKINYHAVFDVAARILMQLPADRRLDDALQRSCQRVLEVARMQVAQEHDLAGRLYHLLLGSIAKPLGTYYTSVSAALLLARLSLDPKRWNLEWEKVDQVSQLRIGDLACGTGTLLAASIQAVTDNFLRTAAKQGITEDLAGRRRQLLESLLEEGIWGFDVLPSATHLTATTLALPIPEVMTRGMRLYSVDLGMRKKEIQLGSLDLLRDTPLTASLSMFPRRALTRGKRVTATASARAPVPLPDQFDLLSMNPPFTRTCGDNLLFGSIPPKQRQKLQKSLSQLLRKKKLGASLTAGLGSVFLALADRHLKTDGRLAFVLPKALLSGVEWEASRKLLAPYLLEDVIASHDPNRWNFSENTDLSEVLVVARKTSVANPEGNTVCVNLWTNQDAPLAALEIAEQLREERVPQLEEGALSLRVGGEKVGEAFSIPWLDLRAMPHWLFPCAFAQSDLVRLVLDLCKGKLPLNSRTYPLPLCPLHLLATLGPDRRRLWATFEVTDKAPGHPAFWGHDATEVTSLLQQPNAYLSKLSKPKEKQRKGYAETLLRQAGNVLIAERMWLNTQSAPAMFVAQPVLSNVWWPVQLRDDSHDNAAKSLIVWLNSTLGLLILLSYRAETRGAWVDFKKPTLQSLPVIDLQRLKKDAMRTLVRCFDEVAAGSIQPLQKIAEDEARKRIDDSVCEALGLPDLAELRERLSLEPILSLRPLTPRVLS